MLLYVYYIYYLCLHKYTVCHMTVVCVALTTIDKGSFLEMLSNKSTNEKSAKKVKEVNNCIMLIALYFTTLDGQLVTPFSVAIYRFFISNDKYNSESRSQLATGDQNFESSNVAILRHPQYFLKHMTLTSMPPTYICALIHSLQVCTE